MVPARALGLALGVALDAALGDPQRHHPVAWFGSWAAACERRLYADDRAAGALHTAASVAPVLALGLAAERASRGRPLLRTALTATATWAVLGGRTLASEADAMASHLEADDLDAARDRLSHLCGRDPSNLPAHELARATVESVAENSNDAVVASLFWGALLGVPGLLVHRALNTLDAMVGHLSPCYARFGTVPARLDDASAFLSARLTGKLACFLAPVVGGSPRRAIRIMLRDAHDHPSPNGGWCEAAWAGALGVRLGGTNVYFGRVEQRGLLGDGPGPDAASCRRAATLSRAVTAAAAALAVAGAAFLDRPREDRAAHSH